MFVVLMFIISTVNVFYSLSLYCYSLDVRHFVTKQVFMFKRVLHGM
jgi:hypothetical protein